MKVLAYNTKGSFADAANRDPLLSFVERESPDVAFFSESHWSRDQDSSVLKDSVTALQNMGYSVLNDDDHDASDRPDRTGWIGMVREELGSGTVMDAQTRKGYQGEVTDPESGTAIRFAGLHFTDRSEPERLVQVTALPEDLDLVMGDINAMHRGAKIARHVRLLKPFAELVPEYDIDFNQTRLKDGTELLKKTAHLIKSVVRMADGSTLDAIQNRYGLVDADPSYQPTIGPFQLDHILANPQLQVAKFTVHEDIKLSDHLPISAVFHT